MYCIYRVYSRERNRLHAKKTRERKKIQSNALQTRIEELREEVYKSFKIIFYQNQLAIIVKFFHNISLRNLYHLP